MLLRNTKESITAISYSIGEPQEHYAKWKKPDAKDYALYYSVCMKYLEKADL